MDRPYRAIGNNTRLIPGALPRATAKSPRWGYPCIGLSHPTNKVTHACTFLPP